MAKERERERELPFLFSYQLTTIITITLFYSSRVLCAKLGRPIAWVQIFFSLSLFLPFLVEGVVDT